MRATRATDWAAGMGRVVRILDRLRSDSDSRRHGASIRRYDSVAAANASATFTGKAVNHASVWRSRNSCCHR